MGHERDTAGTGRGDEGGMALEPVESFNRELRAWVKNNTGFAIGDLKDPRVPRSTIYRHTQGGNLLSREELKSLITVCAPKYLASVERDEWIAAEFRGWYERWRGVEPSSRAGVDIVDAIHAATSSVDGTGSASNRAASAGDHTGLQVAMSQVEAKVAEAAQSLLVSRQSDMLAREIVRELGDVADFIEHAIHGRIVRDGTDLRDLIYQTRVCTTSIRATTTVTTTAVQSGQSWWDARGVPTYLEENKRAIARGVTIHRVFIVDEYEEVIERFIRSHVALGVQASWLHASSLAPALRTNVLVWDGRIGWRAQMTTTGEVSENWLYTGEADVSRLLAIYDACIDLAVTL